MADKVVLPLLPVRILGRSKKQKKTKNRIWTSARKKTGASPSLQALENRDASSSQPSVEKQLQGGVKHAVQTPHKGPCLPLGIHRAGASGVPQKIRPSQKSNRTLTLVSLPAAQKKISLPRKSDH
ncbi:hypothetical protein QC762_0091690 [Podospora pseudocomata]|uniref:Uncharacterized protein n=1 Tax=Podospora pseudocomata TaxID=2093779 RepID=A0ABR0G6I1_9PEZI|nr:hypothetical protein QC762_0091690 [Podospora pseudocomata]